MEYRLGSPLGQPRWKFRTVRLVKRAIDTGRGTGLGGGGERGPVTRRRTAARDGGETEECQLRVVVCRSKKFCLQSSSIQRQVLRRY